MTGDIGTGQGWTQANTGGAHARVASDRRDIDLSVSAQFSALKDYVRANGYSVVVPYVHLLSHHFLRRY